MGGNYRDNEKEYWEERFESETGHRAVGQRSLPSSVNRAIRERTKEQLHGVFKQHDIVISGEEILDAGCGIGFFSCYFAEQGANVHGVDITEQAVDIARERDIPGTYQQSSLENLPYDDSSFYVTYAFSVLMHIVGEDEWERSLAELARVTKPSGYLILGEHWSEESQQDVDHVKKKSKDYYIELLAEHGEYSLEGVYPTPGLQYSEALKILNRNLPAVISEHLIRFVEPLNLIGPKYNDTDHAIIVFKNQP